MDRYKEKIPFDDRSIKVCVKAIEDADYLYKDYISEEEFLTNNGSEGLRWNYINREVKKNLTEERFQIEVLHRGPWGFLGIYDRATKYFYTLMREKNLAVLRKSADARLFHYTNAFSRLNDILKETYTVENEQLCLFPDMMYDEDDEKNLDKILKSMISKIDGTIERYILISFNVSHGKVTSIKGIVPSVGMNYYKEEEWTDLLTASYSQETKDGLEEVTEDIILLERKPKLRRRKKKSEKEEAI